LCIYLIVGQSNEPSSCPPNDLGVDIADGVHVDDGLHMPKSNAERAGQKREGGFHDRTIQRADFIEIATDEGRQQTERVGCRSRALACCGEQGDD